MKFSQIQQRVGNRFKQRIVPIVNGIYGAYSKLATVFGNPITISNASDKPLQGLRIFGKSTQNGTPTPDAPVKIMNVVNPTVKVDSQTLTVPYILCGIPVTSGGNYTDTSGQQWICDEIDFKRGIYIQRTDTISPSTWTHSTTGNGLVRCNTSVNGKMYQPYVGICNRYEHTGNEWGLTDGGFAANCYGTYGVIYITDTSRFKTSDELNTFVSQNPITFVLALTTPIETLLTADQIAAYKALHTNEPNTTISNNQNAEMEVTYIMN